jgi:hypothetical protein
MTEKQKKAVLITDKDSPYFNEWGRIIKYDRDYYYIEIANGKENSIPIFDRDQFKYMKGVNK